MPLANSSSLKPSKTSRRPVAALRSTLSARQTGEQARGDGVLLAAMQRGEAGAVECFYVAYYQLFLGIMMRQVGDFHTAQDLAHDAILKVIRNVSSYTPVAGAPRAWLLSILNNAFVDWTRRRKLRRTTDFDVCGDDGDTCVGVNEPAATEPGPADQVEAAEKIAAVQAALLMLAEEHRQILILRMYAGLCAEEVAEVLGTTVARVGGRLFRARRRLRVILEGNWPDLFPG